MAMGLAASRFVAPTLRDLCCGLQEESMAASRVPVILVHDKPTTLRALEILLPRLKSEGYSLVNFP
jgi:hypothetical protein